jgi:hydroxymethylbilane synthase
LARWQADWVAAQLEQHGIQVEMVLIKTTGDVRSGPIGALATQGVFTKEIQRALLENEIDLAVHSLKDLPTEPVPGLMLGAVPPRAPAGDVLIARHAESFATLPAGARVGTGSMRRRAQLLAARADLDVADIRGNIETRLSKLAEGEYDAIVLAEAALHRLELERHIVQVFDKQVLLPAVGQGALGLEVRESDDATRDVVRLLDDAFSHQAVQAERALLAHLRGGCLAPVGAWARTSQQHFQLDAIVLSYDGQQSCRVSQQIEVANLREADEPLVVAHELGVRAADELLALGAATLIEQSRRASQRDFG